jgi:hypothetical protein
VVFDHSLHNVLVYGDATLCDKLFGGKSIILDEDIRQILLVISRGIKEEIVHASFSSSLF